MLQLDAIESLLLCHLKTEKVWPKGDKQKWTLKYSKFGGRGLFAKCDIQRGEVIFIDKSLLRGPRCYDKYLPMCVNCFKSDCTLFPCDNCCGLPVCSDECEKSTTHVDRECQYLRNLQPTCGTMWCMDLLKVVILIQSLTLCQYQKDLIAILQCHKGPRFGCDEIELLEKNVAKNVEKSDREFMLRLSRILDTNAFETAALTGGKLTSLRGLFPLGAFLNHCCVPNARHYFDKHGMMVVRAAVPIPKGEEIMLAYTDFFWPTSLRWKYLKMTKQFECSCFRCLDSTELDSTLSALKCIDEKCVGYLLPDDPLDLESFWTCHKCMKKISFLQANAIRLQIKETVKEVLRKSHKEVLSFIESELIHLVPLTNYVTLDLKFQIVSYFGRIDDLPWKDLTNEELDFKAKYCNDLILVLDRLTGGDSQKKGLENTPHFQRNDKLALSNSLRIIVHKKRTASTTIIPTGEIKN
ncbi:SET domain-containing protein SmydA-8, isoform A [Pseudolycoriella hygida]|uniref:SET domain-containing protein SmydA-8, isoform A n=1 Tax=Pseudolycoriella hygida TaxID=35572 RepID=A0A9Q0RVM6_9DIPT|nr:SET domain-containing protein SmydA-8, isoform A [Pseudolycoriella hygida]